MDKFVRILNYGGFYSPIRQPRGRDIMAACGQLKSASERERIRRMTQRVEQLVPADGDVAPGAGPAAGNG
jgi:23S rRNA (adenine2503-C2)-methyltransferase